jgi:hypothetical protein
VTERSVRALLLDLAYGPENRRGLAGLRANVGALVEVDRIPDLLSEAFPEVARHPGFADSHEDCAATVAEVLGLEPWGASWLVGVQAKSRLIDVRRVMIYEGSAEAIADIRILGPTVEDFERLLKELERQMPDLRREASHRSFVAQINPDGHGGAGAGAVTVANRPSRVPAPSVERPTFDRAKAEPVKREPERNARGGVSSRQRKSPDHAWRPAWWPRLREWSNDQGFELGKIETPTPTTVRQYVENVSRLVGGEDPLHSSEWRRALRAPTGVTLSDVRRVDIHSHVLHGLVERFHPSLRADPRRPERTYQSLVGKAFLLGLADHVVDVALFPKAGSFTYFALARRLRVAFTVGHDLRLDEALEMHDVCAAHAAALGMSHGGVARATDVLAVTRWDLRSRKIEKALRYRIPMVLIDDFLNAGIHDSLRARIVPFPSRRASVCRNCGIIHARDGRQTHRRDARCPACA